MNQTNETTATVFETKGLSRTVLVRCFLAMVCSHALAPYLVARFTIRYQLDGAAEPLMAVAAVVAIVIGALLAFRQLVAQPFGRKMLYGGVLVALWFLMASVQLAIAADSGISRPLLAFLWGLGTIWIGWSIWGWCFFQAKAIVVGSLLAGLGGVLFWSQVDITGLTGDVRVEFAWRRDSSPQIDETSLTQVADVGAIVWSGYLGSDRAAKVQSLTLREDWDVSPPQQVWRSDCGAGWSSFAATEKMLFTQEQLDDHDCVTARSLSTGELVWVAEEAGAGFTSGVGGHGPRATPTLHRLETPEGERMVLFAIGPSGIFRCLDASSGDVVWDVDVCELFPGEPLEHAVCNSPLVVGELVVVCPPAKKGPCLVAFDVSDGRMVWKCDSTLQASYSSPVTVVINDREQIAVHAGDGVLAVDPVNGGTLWQFKWTNEWNNNATQPLPLAGFPNELVLATGYRGGVVRVAIDADADSYSPREVWSNKSTMRTKFCNVSQFGDLLIGLDNGILCGVDVASGKQLWKNGRYGHGQTLQVGRHCLVVAERGKLFLLRPDAEGPQELASFEALDRKTWNHPVLIEDRLVVRNDQEIICLKLPVQD